MSHSEAPTGHALPTGDPADHGFDPSRLERIADWASRYVETGKLPGVGVLIARDGRLVYQHYTGYRDVDNELPLEGDTLLRMFSMTKPVTGAALMMLLEEGRFWLDDPIAEFLEEFDDLRVLAGGGFQGLETERARPLTIRELATHTAGLTYEFFPHDPVSALYREAGITAAQPAPGHQSLEDWCHALARMPLRAQPGTSWHYSVGMDVLGRLIEVLSGQRFGDFLRQRIFSPLGMTDSDFLVPSGKVDRFANSYRPAEGERIALLEKAAESVYLEPPKVDFGGSGLISTPRDYLRFAQMLLNGGSLGAERLLSPKTVELMTSNHLGPEIGEAPVTSLSSMRWFKGAGFGITGLVMVDPAKNGVPGSVGEFGWGGAASTNFWIDPLEDLAVVLVTQLVPSGTYPLRPQIRSLVYQALVE